MGWEDAREKKGGWEDAIEKKGGGMGWEENN